jgi:glycine/D-amino acid oxidase-like deaminating enzyme
LADEKEAGLPLDGAFTADVCIVGGGFTGLWTALTLKADNPSLDIVVVEGDICGGGASGRNGGFVMSWWSKFSTLKKLCGTEEAVRLAHASADAVTAIGQFCAEHGIDAEYHDDGWLWTATSRAQVGAWDAALTAARASGELPFERLSNAEVARRSSSPVHLAGVFEPTCATVHPGRLSRGLAGTATAQGIRVFEHSPVTHVRLDDRPTVLTERGKVTADSLVLAINAWAAQLDELQRSLVVIASDVIATDPVPDRLSALGWKNGVAISDSHRLVNYYRRTDDGRVVFGKGGGTLGYAGRVSPSFHRASPRLEEVAAQFHRLYPMLWDVPAARSWRGPIDYSLTGLPAFVRIGGRPDVLTAAGFSGNGVAPTYVAGRILASMVQDKDDEWASTGLARLPRAGLPPEPLRFVGGLSVRAAIARKEALEDADRRAGPLTRAVASMDPTSFVDRGPGDVVHSASPPSPVTADRAVTDNLNPAEGEALTGKVADHSAGSD